MRIPQTPPDINALTASFVESEAGAGRLIEILMAGIGPIPDGKYRHWDILRHLTPPTGWTVQEWWFAIKTARRYLMREIPLLDGKRQPFRYAMTDTTLRMLSEIDRNATGAIRGSDQITSPHLRDTYIIKSLMEEAITSSQLEGASTTQEVAKEMIQSGRQPRDVSERMIFNNYHAMIFIRQIKDRPLTPSIVFELHRILTEGTLDDPSAAGRFRREDERVEVVDQMGTVLHVPPAASGLEERMRAMCEFANADESEEFLHPVIRAILLHFWLAYDHPFLDGNGRTARALFYWSMARSEYWLCEFLSISSILRKAPEKYARSFLYVETDDNDATYFFLAQLRVILRAIDDLHTYLAKKSAELDETRGFLQNSQLLKSLLNHRQLTLINHALKNPHHAYTISSHGTSHNVSYHTARTDLLQLAKHELLDQHKSGKTLYFIAPPNLKERLGRVRGGA